MGLHHGLNGCWALLDFVAEGGGCQLQQLHRQFAIYAGTWTAIGNQRGLALEQAVQIAQGVVAGGPN